MKKHIQRTAEEYKRILSSDRGVADIQEIYSDDINCTQSDLNTVLQVCVSFRNSSELCA